MSKLMILSLLSIMVMLMINSTSPMMMVIIMLMMTFLLSFESCETMMDSWFSYLFILVLLSGMLSLLGYMASLVPNIKTMSLYKSFFLIPFVFILLDTPNHSLMLEKPISILMNSSMMVFSILYLLFSLMMVMNIIETKEGPLRN